MQSCEIDFDVTPFKSALEEEVTTANGWELVTEGTVRKDSPDCPIKIYKKKAGCDALITICLEGTMKNVNIDKFYKLLTDFELISKGETTMKKLLMVEKLSKNSDIMYSEVNVPFPLTNREFLVKRVYLFSQEDAELMRQLGLFNFEHKYFVVMQRTTERSDYPEKSQPVRGEIKLGCWLIQEDPKEPNSIKFRQVICQDLKGSIPSSVTNKAAPQKMHDSTAVLLGNYRKFFGKE